MATSKKCFPGLRSGSSAGLVSVELDDTRDEATQRAAVKALQRRRRDFLRQRAETSPASVEALSACTSTCAVTLRKRRSFTAACLQASVPSSLNRRTSSVLPEREVTISSSG